MKNLFKYILFISTMLLVGFMTTACDDRDDIVNPKYDTLFSPVDLEVRVVNRTEVRLNWKNVVSKADSYTVEIYGNGDEDYSGTPVKTVTGILLEELPYIIVGLEGESDYSVRVQAVSENIASSKWTSTTFKTDAEQIFYSIDEEELTATGATLRWSAGSDVTELIIVPSDITYTITDAEKTAGVVTLTGLTSETEYTVTLKNGTKTRGTIKFTTLIDLGDASPIYEGDDIVAILDAASDGDSFVIMSGEFELGEYTLTKAMSLSGYKANEKPTLKGNIVLSGTVGSLDLKNLIFDGSVDNVPTRSYVINGSATAVVGDVNIIGCEINNYKSGFMNNNSGAKYGDVLISDCIITNILGDGGDGFDFRAGGTLTSLTVEKSTFNTGFRAFLRMQITTDAKFKNCTFYKISNIDNSNNTGIFRTSGGTLEVSQCLFVETGVNNPTAASSGNWCRNSSSMGATPYYSDNIYNNCHNLWVGLYTNPAACSAVDKDPQFADATNGDFTVNNIEVDAGDPRWLP